MDFFQRSSHLLAILLTSIAFSISGNVSANEDDIGVLLDDVIDGPHRSEDNRARDSYRHPKETLLFFGLRAEMTAVEIAPASGWYTEIIAPAIKQKGKFIGAVPTLAPDAPETFKRRDVAYKNMLANDPILYGSANTVTYDPKAPVFTTPMSADIVMTFRNVHNWAKAGTSDAMFKAFYETLKPGGILGVVEHRAKPGTSFQKQIDSGYMTETYVIETAQRAGFRLVAKSEINRNPLDTTEHPGGVWTLPPSLRGVKDMDKQSYLTIGESDRMTLKFSKK